eukprot:275240_1
MQWSDHKTSLITIQFFDGNVSLNHIILSHNYRLYKNCERAGYNDLADIICNEPISLIITHLNKQIKMKDISANINYVDDDGHVITLNQCRSYLSAPSNATIEYYIFDDAS